MLTHEEQMDLLIRKVIEVLSDRIRKEVPAEGSFRQVGVRYHHPETQLRGFLSLEEDLLQEGNRRLTVSMFLEGDDRVVSNYLKKGTNEEILDYLLSEEAVSELIGVFEHLKEKLEGML